MEIDLSAPPIDLFIEGMIAQKEIAKLLGISAVTVSRALRNHPDLAVETRERILQKASEMGYPRQQIENGRRTVKRLGVLLYEKDPAKAHDQFWLSDAEIPRRILTSIQKEARKIQVEIIFELPPSEKEIPLMIRNRTVDGVIVMGRYDAETLSHLRNVPALSVSSYIATDWLPRIVVDNFRGTQAITEHLISLGHKDILFIGAEDAGSTEIHRERAKGYFFAMHSHGLTPKIDYCPGYNITPLAKKILAQTAIVASSDTLAYPIQDLFKENGKNLPQDCSIVAFDGNHRSVDRKVTTYAPDWALLGRMAVDYLVYRAQGLQGSGVEVVTPGRLVVRESAQSI